MITGAEEHNADFHTGFTQIMPLLMHPQVSPFSPLPSVGDAFPTGAHRGVRGTNAPAHRGVRGINAPSPPPDLAVSPVSPDNAPLNFQHKNDFGSDYSCGTDSLLSAGQVSRSHVSPSLLSFSPTIIYTIVVR